MKKFKLSMLTCATMVAISTASFGATGKVNTDTARIRSEASSESSIIDLLSIDDKVEILEEAGDWYKIKSGEKTGYISKSLLDVDGTVEKQETKVEETNTNETVTNEVTENTTEPKATEEAAEAEKEQETTTATEKEESKLKESFVGNLSSEVTIKILPSINSIDIAKIEKNTEITVVEIINDWCHIEAGKFSGWARVKVVEGAITEQNNEEQTATEEETTEEVTETKKGYVNVESVNIRKEKSTSSDILDNLTKNSEVTILAEEGEWYKIKINDSIGYVSKQYISDKKVEEVTSRASDTARQILENKEPEEKADTAETTTKKTSSKSGAEVVAFAKQYLGYDYVSGGASPSTGFDCSGFTSYVYKNFGVSLNRTSSGQKSDGVAVSKSELEQGDILCFSGHVGIYIGNNQFIHASNPSGGVKITSLSDSYYVKNYITARRVLE
ncbi:MAG: SH3 domain-containing protein [Clostridia bacterium]|nr:SH3 domain-containing protein [Clostridia bacterium]